VNDAASAPPLASPGVGRNRRPLRLIVLGVSHLVTLAVGFALGIYLLPILTSPAGPSIADVRKAAEGAPYRATLRRGLRGSDPFHWGEGTIAVGPRAIVLEGRLAPGPDYKLYLVAGYVEDEEAFLRVKKRSPRVGEVKTFENFVVAVPEGIDIEQYDIVLVWCERFKQFITSAKYR
jgi:hypothetical protein